MKKIKLAALAVSAALLCTNGAFANNNQTYSTTINILGGGLNIGAGIKEKNPAMVFEGVSKFISGLSKVPGFDFLDSITPDDGPNIAQVMAEIQKIEEQLAKMNMKLDDIVAGINTIEYQNEYNDFNRNLQSFTNYKNTIDNGYSVLQNTIGSIGKSSLPQALNKPSRNDLIQLSSAFRSMDMNNFSTAIEVMSDGDGHNYITSMIEDLREVYILKFQNLEAGSNAINLFGEYNKSIMGIYSQTLIGLQKAVIVKDAIIDIDIAVTQYNQLHPEDSIDIIPYTVGLQATDSSTAYLKSQFKKINQNFINRTETLKRYFMNPLGTYTFKSDDIQKTEDVFIPNTDFRMEMPLNAKQAMYYRNAYNPNAISGKSAANGDIYLAAIIGYKPYGDTMWNLVIDNNGDENSAHWVYGNSDLPTQITPADKAFSDDHGPELQTIMDLNAMINSYQYTGMNITPNWERDLNSPNFLYTTRDSDGNWISLGKYSSSTWVNPHFGKAYQVPSITGEPINVELPAEANMLSLVPLVYHNDPRSTELPGFTRTDLINRYLNIFNPLEVATSTNNKLNQQADAVTYNTVNLKPNMMTQPLKVEYKDVEGGLPMDHYIADIFLVQGGLEFIPGYAKFDYVGKVFKETYIPRLIVNYSNGTQSDNVASSYPENMIWYLTIPEEDHLKGNYLQMQTDGNLVEYAKEGDNGFRALWSSAQTQGYHTGQSGVLTIQSDGNIVVYHNNGTTEAPSLDFPLWETGKACTGVNPLNPNSCQISSIPRT